MTDTSNATDTSNKTSTSKEVDDSIDQGKTSAAGVGTLLHATRERIGESVEDVAVKLRINRRYIQALEDGRVEDLPAVAYAIGFVRTYADHLGLDSGEIVRRFKEEVDGVSISNGLDFPAPVPESGIPSGAVLVAAVIVAILAYGGWYLTASEDSVILEGVEEVPSRLVEDTPASDAVVEEVVEEATPEAVVEETPIEAVVAEAVEEVTEEVSAVVEPIVEPINESGAEAVPEVVEAVVEEVVEDVPAAVVEVEPVVEATVIEHVEPVVEATVAPVVEAVPVVEETVAAVEPVIESVTEPVVEPVVQAVVAAVKKPVAAKQGRVVLRAISNSWIQITDSASGKSVVTRMLRKGSEYTVEDRADLQLSTGNAGALEVLVDGVVVPAIGKPGEVVRNLSLDANALKGGEQ